jgi:hypothetical protein
VPCRRPLLAVVAAVAVSLCAVSAAAQAPASAASAAGTASTSAPRSPAGRVSLGSAPGHKGYWEARPGLGGTPRPADVPIQPWARALSQYRSGKADLYPPLVRCKPAGGPAFFNAPGFDFIDDADLQSLFIVNIAGPHSWRVVYMDGRPHPTGDTLRPTYLGHSVGRWEGDTLVIDSVGFNEKQWLVGSYPTTEQLHLTERIARPDLMTLSYEATIDDPGAYTAPWSLKWTITSSTASKWIPDGEIFEYICQDDGK